MLLYTKNHAPASIGFETSFYKTQFLPLLNKTSLLGFVCFPSSSFLPPTL